MSRPRNSWPSRRCTTSSAPGSTRRPFGAWRLCCFETSTFNVARGIVWLFILSLGSQDGCESAPVGSGSSRGLGAQHSHAVGAAAALACGAVLAAAKTCPKRRACAPLNPAPRSEHERQWARSVRVRTTEPAGRAPRYAPISGRLAPNGPGLITPSKKRRRDHPIGCLATGWACLWPAGLDHRADLPEVATACTVVVIHRHRRWSYLVEAASPLDSARSRGA